MPDIPQTLDASRVLARWLSEVQADESGSKLHQLVNDGDYATLWYTMRAAGERLRGQALGLLNAQRVRPGGAYPDPLDPAAAAWSQYKIACAAAVSLGLHLVEMPYEPAQVPEQTRATSSRTPRHTPSSTAGASTPRSRPAPGSARAPAVSAAAAAAPAAAADVVLAWLITHIDHRQPVDLAIRAGLRGTPNEVLQVWHMACLMALYARERAVLTGPGAPAGEVLLPHATHMRHLVPLLHQYAKGLLWPYPPPPCAPTTGCWCNEIQQRYNERPPGHEQPTDALNISDLRRAVERGHGRDRSGGRGRDGRAPSGAPVTRIFPLRPDDDT